MDNDKCPLVQGRRAQAQAGRRATDFPRYPTPRACLSVGSSNKLGRIQPSTALLAVYKLYRGPSGEISPMSKLRFTSSYSSPRYN